MSVYGVLLILIVGPSLLAESAPIAACKGHWVIVFDAGSTKTRMNLYQFCMKAETTKWIPLRSESKTWGTGLSQFNPNNATDRVNIWLGFYKLFKYAEGIITVTKDRRDTPVFLYATAGLRGLPPKTAYKLLNISNNAISQSAFDHSFNKNEMTRTQMISGRQEGIFAWLSVNYLVSKDIDNQTSTHDLGIVDMGGGSTQIAFRPHDYHTVVEAGIEPGSLWYPGSNRTKEKRTGPGVYSKSFADYGFSSTAMKYVGAYDECRPKHRCPTGKMYSSVCLNPNYKSIFHFGPYVFPISGTPLSDPSERYYRCVQTARKILKKYGAIPANDMKPINILLRHEDTIFFGVAGYYYLVKDIAHRTTVNVPSADTAANGPTRCQGYEMLLKRFREGAKQLCANVPGGTDPFLPYVCIRATYVTVLLEEAYKFRPDTVYHMCKTMPAAKGSRQNIEIGWPLGVAQQAAEKVLEKHFPPK